MVYYTCFLSDPHIDKKDAKQLIKEIASSLRKLSEDRFVLVSFGHCDKKYERYLLPILDNVVEVTDDANDDRILQVRTIDYSLTKSKRVSLERKELQLVS
jgi:catalase